MAANNTVAGNGRHLQLPQSRLRPHFVKVLPDDMQIVSEISHTATDKINKLKLRETFKEYRLPTE